ncbi:hypothetical protein BGZ83_010433 [Gryganskiella cystojenkinii]|nr:hypothetical protein BGZ83_010433 [Gryganskiella cystojenkinii]
MTSILNVIKKATNVKSFGDQAVVTAAKSTLVTTKPLCVQVRTDEQLPGDLLRRIHGVQPPSQHRPLKEVTFGWAQAAFGLYQSDVAGTPKCLATMEDGTKLMPITVVVG